MSRDFIFRIKRGEALPPTDPSGSRILFNEEKQSFEILSNTGNVSEFISGGGSASVDLINPVTYSSFRSLIESSSLNPGSYYLITDYKTCYDQPDFDYDGYPIVVGNYKQGPIEPILVLAISAGVISENAFQPNYPNDNIKYDWDWKETEVTSGQAFGRITERIDEFNNRTDYDHRNILFKRYRLFTYREELRLNGTIELLSDGTVNGTNTTFTALTVGDIVYVANTTPSYFEIVSITDNVTMTVSADTINNTGSRAVMYKTVEETNDNDGYFSYKQTNVKTYDFIEYTTFGDAISNDYAKNNYIGNYANNYQDVAGLGGGTFLLSNNVFLEGAYESNKFGDYCYNNTWGTDNSNNIWGDYCYNNVSTNDVDNNIIGHNFLNNLINVNLTNNTIGNDFRDNQLLAENEDDFENNTIGNSFYGNIIYSRFYENTINYGFEDNTIGDYGNINNFTFYRNYIANNFNGNIIKQTFQNNKIGTNFQENEINGEFYNNSILNGFNRNKIGHNFAGNEIGPGFSSNVIFDDFVYNKIGFRFSKNLVSTEFGYNDIRNDFGNNSPSNKSLYNWNDLSTVSTRVYDTFYNALDGTIGNLILGKELIMRVISTSQYFKFKFTQWTQGGNGGGFQYEREEIDSNGNSLGPVITFTKTNNGSEVDVIVPSVVELTRDSQGGIYNTITDTPPFGGQWPGPGDTEWNSIYTEPNSGRRFAYNKIGNNFYRNVIDNDFGYGFGNPEGNIINDNFEGNAIGEFMYNNVIGNYFMQNTIGNNFENNTIKNYFVGNTILDNFESNEIGDYFGNDGDGPGSPIQNIIFNNFKYNKIGNFFGNDTNFPTVGGGSNGDGGNIINDGFQFNVIGDNFIFNAIDLNFTNNKIGNDFWFNTFGQNNSDNTIGNLFVGNSGIGGAGNPIGDNFISNNIGNYSAFNEIDSDFQYNKIGDFFGNAGDRTQNIISSGFRYNSIGSYFGDDGSQLDGGNVINVNFYENVIGNRYYSNLIDGEFFRNILGSDFSSNSISGGTGSVFFNNQIGSGFSNNSTEGVFSFNKINDGVSRNTIGEGFSYNLLIPGGLRNCTIGQNFKFNTISANLSIIDFTSGPATHVYGNYNCTLFTRQDGKSKLSYYDNSNVLNIVNVDA